MTVPEPSERPSASRVSESVHQPVMGTVLQIRTVGPEAADAVEEMHGYVVAEVARLQSVFTVFDPTSELCRWRSDPTIVPGPELADLLRLAHRWQVRSAGAFNPAAGVLTARWLQAQHDGIVPSDAELASIAASIAEPRFEPDGRHRGDCSQLNLNAIAKGFVVDRVARDAAERFGLESITLNAGGDLVHVGAGAIRVGVEDPARPHDNVAPLAVVGLADGALATSGSARRWFTVGGRRVNQVLDPRTGQPIDAVRSVSVIAPDGGTADVAATVLSVLDAGAAVSLADAEGLACLLVHDDGSTTRNDAWARLGTDWPGTD